MTWLEVCLDKSLRDLPYKVELNRLGKIEMSPHRRHHGLFQGRLSLLLGKLLQQGEVVVECAIDTSDGVRVADVAWVSSVRWASMSDAPSCSIAPEICIEVVSEANSSMELAHKRALYFQSGAIEVWQCDEKGGLTFFTPQGEVGSSSICPNFPKSVA